MFSQDYILRIIRQAAAVLAQALGLKKAGQYREAGQAVNQALEILTGLPIHLVSTLDDDSLLDLLRGPGGEPDIERLLLAAAQTREEADLLTLEGREADGTASYLRALKFFLVAFLASGAVEPGENGAEIEALAARFHLPSLPEEVQADLEAYYEATGQDR
jgi:hypothetical protein